MSTMFVGIDRRIRCGVADYAEKLYQYARKSDDVEYKHAGDLRSWGRLFMRAHRFDSIVLQYPARLYARSMLPFLLVCYSRLVGTAVFLNLHENSEARFGRKCINWMLMLVSSNTIMTSRYECMALSEWQRKKAYVSGIGANIVPRDTNIFMSRKEAKLNRKIVFFGLIKRDNGIARYMELAEGLADGGCANIELVLIGSVVDKTFFAEVKEQAAVLGVELLTDISEEDVSRELSSASFAYLWYPDGVSDRRGAFLACITHGLVTFANEGRQTSASISDGFINSDANPVIETIKRFEADTCSYHRYLDSLELVAKEYNWNVLGNKFRTIIEGRS